MYVDKQRISLWQKMKLKNLTIRRLLVLGAAFITTILIFIAFLTNFFIANSFDEFKLISRLDFIAKTELEIRKAEKDFLNEETINPDFFISQKSKYLETIHKKLSLINEELELLKENKHIKKLKLEHKITIIQNEFLAYNESLEFLKTTVLKKGFKDFGTIGQMRKEIHTIESQLEKQQNNLFSAKMLMLRRHEKDYLLRKDLKYQEKFNKVIAEFTDLLKKQGNVGNSMIKTIQSYQYFFEEVINYDKQLGYNNLTGTLYQLNTSINKIESNLKVIQDEIKQSSTKQINKTISELFISLVLLSALIVLLFMKIGKHIIKSINNLSHYINRLGNGELPDEIKIYNSDEIAKMKASINELTKNLKNTRDFAIAVGNGEFNKEINVFNNQGDLGSNLLEMRKKLLQVSEERMQQQKEAEQRNWTNQGLAEFSELFRQAENNIEDFCANIMKKMVKYMKAYQGSFFLYNEENSYLELLATYAYDRRKYLKSKLSIGEGLIGECAIEKEAIFLTDIPENYIEITSASGSAKPRCIYISPLIAEGKVKGIIELASFTILERFEREFIDKLSVNLASTLNLVQVNLRTKTLYETTSQQAVELQSKEEEMRQNLEELTATQEMMEEREHKLRNEINELSRENVQLRSRINDLMGKKYLQKDALATFFEEEYN